MSADPIRTERLVIRPFTLEDEQAADALWQAVWARPLRPETLRWLALAPRELATLYQPPLGDRALCIADSGELIGAVGLTPANGPFQLLDSPTVPPTPVAWSVEIGLFWSLHPRHRGHGYATEAARALVTLACNTCRVDRVVAHTEHDNVPSRRVMARLGMDVRSFRDVPGAPWFQVVGRLPLD